MFHLVIESLNEVQPPGIDSGLGIAHLFSEQSACFLPKSEQMSNLLEKVSDLLRSLIFGERLERIPHGSSFLVSDLSETLTVAQFWWASWAIRSHLSEQIAQIAHPIWANEQTAHVFGKKWVICSENWWPISQFCWDSVSPLPPENLFSEITYNCK